MAGTATRAACISSARCSRRRAAADRGDLRGADARHRRGAARRHDRRHRRTRSRTTPKPSAARSCAISAATASAGCSTTSPTSCITAGAAKASLLKPGMFFTIEPMINLGRAAGEGAVRRLDGGDPRPLAVGAVRAYGRRDRDRRRGVHALAGRARTGLSPLAPAEPHDERTPDASPPHYLGHRERLRDAVPGGAAPRRWPITNCSN